MEEIKSDKNLQSLLNIVKRLHELNFGAEGIIRPDGGGEDYDYCTWKKQGDCHKYECAEGNFYCEKCDGLVSVAENGYRLDNISHGTHMLDFIRAHNFEEEEYRRKLLQIADWSQKPVIFVMENPGGRDNEYYNPGELEELTDDKKSPLKSWYWLNKAYSDKDEKYFYPNYFCQGSYGGLVYAVMNTFNIANGYLTNMVKCGAGVYKDGNSKYEYYSTDKYEDDIIKNCIDLHLTEEIDCLWDKGMRGKVIIFAFGKNVYYTLSEKLKQLDKYALYLLPHPASRLANDYRKYALYSKILRALYKNDFYDGVEFDPVAALKNDNEGDVPQIKKSVEEVEGIITEAIKTISSCPCEKSEKYYCGEITYQIQSLNDNYATGIILRAKKSRGKKLLNDTYTVLWASYDFYEGLIDLWGGYDDKNTATNLIPENARENIELYKILKDIAEKLKNS